MDRVKELASKGWAWFRRLPWWGQALGYLVVISVIAGPFIDRQKARDEAAARQKAETTIVTEPPVTENVPASTTPDPTTTTAPVAPTTTTLPSTTTGAATTTSVPPTTVAPTTVSATTTPAETTTTEPELPDSFSGLNPSRVFARDFDPWPLSVDTGLLGCLDGGLVVFGVDGGATYAINGLAIQQMETRGWLRIDEIWLDSPDVEGLKINIGELLDLGLSLC